MAALFLVAPTGKRGLLPWWGTKKGACTTKGSNLKNQCKPSTGTDIRVQRFEKVGSRLRRRQRLLGASDVLSFELCARYGSVLTSKIH